MLMTTYGRAFGDFSGSVSRVVANQIRDKGIATLFDDGYGWGRDATVATADDDDAGTSGSRNIYRGWAQLTAGAKLIWTISTNDIDEAAAWLDQMIQNDRLIWAGFADKDFLIQESFGRVDVEPGPPAVTPNPAMLSPIPTKVADDNTWKWLLAGLVVVGTTTSVIIYRHQKAKAARGY